MSLPEIVFSTKMARRSDLLSNLRACDTDFVPPLSERVDLEEYSVKLFENSITFEAWHNQRLIGMIAAYFNNTIDSTGFITNVCVEKDYKGKNIATDLMIKCLEYARKNGFKNITLEVNNKNTSAINLYKKFNFESVSVNNGDVRMTLEINN